MIGGFGGFGEFDREPAVAAFAGGEETREKLLSFGGVSGEDSFLRVMEADFVRRVKGADGFDDAVEFEVGENGFEDERTNVGRAREFVAADIEGIAATQEVIDEGADREFIRGITMNEILERDEVVGAGKGFAVGGKAVAARASDFLLVVFESFREIEMKDGADVRFVDAHAESDGSDDDIGFVAHEGVLGGRADFVAETCVVGASSDAGTTKMSGERFRGFLEGGVDDGRERAQRSEAGGEEFDALGCEGRGDGDGKIGAMEGSLDEVSGRDAEKREDFLDDRRSGRRGESEDARDPEFFCDFGEAEIFRAEVMSPFRDAVRLIDREKGERNFFEAEEEGFVEEAFRRNIEEFERTRGSRFEDGLGLFGRKSGVEPGRRVTMDEEGIHLVFHQGNERRNDNRESGQKEGGKLVADRFAAACRKKCESGMTFEERGDDFFLAGEKAAMTEEFLEVVRECLQGAVER